MNEARDWIDLLERREREAEARETLDLRRGSQVEEPDGAHLGQALAQARVAAGMSLEDLAERIETSVSTLQHLEESADAGHSLALLRRVAEAMHMDLHVGFQARS